MHHFAGHSHPVQHQSWQKDALACSLDFFKGLVRKKVAVPGS